MADALCGPSNALQNFQKHTSTDRTLQQDRLTSRQTPGQSFRSGPGPNAGILDPEFEAFQAGQAGHFIPQEAPHLRSGFPQPHINFTAPPAPVADWASDFQRLRVSQPPAQFQSRPIQQQSSSSSWHQDFLQQSALPAPSLAQQSPMYGQTFGGSFQNFVPDQSYTIAQGKQTASDAAPQFDEAAFERAFQMADQDLDVGIKIDGAQATEETINQAVQESDSRWQELLDTPGDVQRMEAADGEEVIRILEQDERMAEPQAPVDNPPVNDEALARTAGHLLDSVSDNTSAKFQQSNFLALMRRIRDHEVRVEGDKMVEVKTEVSTSPAAASGLDSEATM